MEDWLGAVYDQHCQNKVHASMGHAILPWCKFPLGRIPNEMGQNEVVSQPISYSTPEKLPFFKTAEPDLEPNILSPIGIYCTMSFIQFIFCLSILCSFLPFWSSGV